jgi:transcriptional regulator NrdR family protein
MKTILDSLSTVDGKQVRIIIKCNPSHKQYWTYEQMEKVQKLVEKIENIVKDL